MTLDDLCASLLPPVDHLHVATLRIEEQHLTLVAAMTAPQAVCPDCHQPSQRLHSGYPRTLADLPWAVMPVTLVLHVRRFFCDTAACGRTTFTERLPAVAPVYARTTARLRQRQAEIGLALGGAAGARQLARQGLPGSRNTVLRRVRRLPTPLSPPPQVIGLDEWAWRKGHRYGTIVVDLERGCPIDVLEDRATHTVAAWLQAHPDIKVVARDRAEAYGAGIRQGAPEVTQVADRFHLLKNVASALHEVFNAHPRELDTLHTMAQTEPLPRDDGAVAVAVGPRVVTSRAQQQIEHNRTRRVAEYAQARELRQQGWTIKAIAARLGRNRRTVKKYLQASTFPERQPRRRRYPRVLDPFKAYLVERWQAGCHNAKQLFGAITSQGFRGQYSIVAEYTSRWRTAQERGDKRRRSGPCAPLTEADTPLTPRGATWLVLRREATLDEAQRQQIARLRQHEGEIAEAITLAQDFATLVRQRQPANLDPWLERAIASCLQPFQSFAKGLREDYAAVKAGVTLSWSTGPVEGQINRLKMLKRQMYGRANTDLLRQRVLLPT